MLTDQNLTKWSRNGKSPYKGAAPGTYHCVRKQSYGSLLLDEYPDYWLFRDSVWSYRTKRGYDPLLETPQGLIAQSRDKVLRPYDSGHEFKKFRARSFASHKDFFVQGAGGGYYKGPLIPVHVPLGLGNIIDSDPYYTEPVISHASNAMRSTIPSKSAENLAQALGELLVDLPRIPGSLIGRHPETFKDFVRNSADEYLNQAFAWSPLASDVLKTAKAVIQSKKILDQYMRDSGRQVRRSYRYPIETTMSTSETTELGVGLQRIEWNTNSFLSLYSNRSDSIAPVTTTIEQTRKEWFSGAWMYYVDEGNTLIDKVNLAAQKAQKLLGVKLTLEVLWDLAPWSWLADWFANIGDIISINSQIAFDNLVLRYGYFMQTVKTRITVTHPGVYFTYGGNIGPINHVLEYQTDERIRATPYGFGLSPDSFSELQWAILAALGLTKNPRKLWTG